jgi:hypothetical protein
MKTIKLETIDKNKRLYQAIIDALKQRNILAYVRTASTGNIHIIVEITKTKKFSVIRFAYKREFAIFYPAFSREQNRDIRKEWTDVVNYFIARTEDINTEEINQ